MGRFFRIRLQMRRFTRRHQWLFGSIRLLLIFSAAFGGAYGFMAGSLSQKSGYDPNAFAIGASFMFAIACVALAALSMRLRFLRKKLRKIASHNEALADRNWELQEAEQRARSLFESQSDLIVMRDPDGRITFVNDTYCQMADRPAEVADRQPLRVRGSRTGRQRDRSERHPNPRPADRNPAWPEMDRLARGPASSGRRPARRAAMRRS